MATATGLGWGNSSPFQVTYRRSILGRLSSHFAVRTVRQQRSSQVLLQTLLAAQRSVVRSHRLSSLALLAVLCASNKSLRATAVANRPYANCVTSRTFFSVPEHVDKGFTVWSPCLLRQAIGQPLPAGTSTDLQIDGQLWPRYR